MSNVQISKRLSPDVAARLNEQFYRSSPHRYFELRLLSLLALDSLPDELGEGELPSSTVGEVALGDALEFDPQLLTRGERETYVASEAEVLLHHVSEVLVRYFLGHDGFPPCPWMEIAALSNFREFKRRAAGLVTADVGRLQGMASLLLFNDAESDDDKQRTQTEIVVSTLQAAASRILADAPLYNAAKHGFTVLAGRSLLRFHSTPEPDESDEERTARVELEAFLSDRGLTLETLEWVYDSGGRHWATKTRYVDPDHAVAAAWVTTRVLANVTRTMTARYSGGGDVAWYVLSESFTPDELLRRSAGKGTTLQVPLAALPLPDPEARRLLDELGYDEAETTQ